MTRKVFIGLTVLATGTVIAGSTYALSQRSEAQPAVQQFAAEIQTLQETEEPTPTPTPTPLDTQTPTPTAVATATPSPAPTILVTATPSPTPSPEPTPTKYVRYPNPKDDKETKINKICETFDTEADCQNAIITLNAKNPGLTIKSAPYGYGLFAIRCWEPALLPYIGATVGEPCNQLLDEDFNIRMAKIIYEYKGKKPLFLN